MLPGGSKLLGDSVGENKGGWGGGGVRHSNMAAVGQVPRLSLIQACVSEFCQGVCADASVRTRWWSLPRSARVYDALLDLRQGQVVPQEGEDQLLEQRYALLGRHSLRWALLHTIHGHLLRANPPENPLLVKVSEINTPRFGPRSG